MKIAIEIPVLIPVQTVNEWIGRSATLFGGEAVNRHLSKSIAKEFSMMDNQIWASWQEFGSHKSVSSWVITTDGYAIGFNENPSTGWSYPVKKLSPEQIEKYMNHTQSYDEYYGIKRDEE